MENADHIISNTSLQRYQTVPMKFYEKYIDDERLKYVAMIVAMILILREGETHGLGLVPFKGPFDLTP